MDYIRNAKMEVIQHIYIEATVLIEIVYTSVGNLTLRLFIN